MCLCCLSSDILGPREKPNITDDSSSSVVVGNRIYSAETKRLMSAGERGNDLDWFSTEYEPTFKSNQLNNIHYNYNNCMRTTIEQTTDNVTNPV